MRPFLAYLVLLLTLVVTYGRTLDAPLIWDDRHLILEAPQITQNQTFAQRFRQPFWVDDGSGDARAYYRPLTVLSFAFDHSLHGENSAGYHLTNAALQTLNALLLLALLLRHRADTRVALLLSAAWALHPRLTEAAAWVSGRTDVLATTFCFLALLAHRSRSLGRSVASAVLLLLGLASKEVALAGVAALVAKELCWHAPGPRNPRSWRHGLPFTLPLLGALLAYAALRLSALAGTQALFIPLSFGERLGTALEAIGRYVFDLAVPWLPRAQQGKLGLLDYRFLALGLGAVTLAAVAAPWLRRRWEAPATDATLSPAERAELGALGGVSVLLVLHLIPISLAVVAADRFLYLPLAAVALGLARPVSRWVQNRTLMFVPLVGLTLTFGWATMQRLDEWRSELGFWRQTYATTPKTNSLPGNELGNVYYRASLFEQALRIYRVTSQTVADDPYVLGNTANALTQLGRYDEALQLFTRLCREHADVASHCQKAALVALNELHVESARQLLAEANKRAPNSPATRQVASAIDKLGAAAQNPDLTSDDPSKSAEARFRLALLSGRRPDALQVAEQLLREPRAAATLRREAAEYYIRYGSPVALAHVARAPEAADIFAAPALRDAAALRLEEGQKLLEAWPELGFGAP